MNSGSCRNRNILSYVLFDTESTGLPSPGNSPRITELCLIAITREELQSKQREYRVFNKLNLCVNPCKQIHHRSSELTGLHNDSLSLQATFSKQADLIVTFLRNLPQPTCLVAHNGHRFDFPLLKSELKRSNKSLSENVHCADTLEAFRTFDGLAPVPEFVKHREQERKMQHHQISKCEEISTSVLNLNANSAVSEQEQNKKVSDKLVMGNDIYLNQSNKKRNVDSSSMLHDESERSLKERKFESPSVNQLPQSSIEMTPNCKTSSTLSSHHGSNKTDKTHTNDKNNLGMVENVRKRLFTSPKLSLKSWDIANESNLQNESKDISTSSIDNSCSGGIQNDNDDNNKSLDDSSTQRYSISEDTHTSKLNDSESSQHQQMNITDSDKDFLEACQEVDQLLPSVLSKNVVTVTKSEAKQPESKISTTQNHSNSEKNVVKTCVTPVSRNSNFVVTSSDNNKPKSVNVCKPTAAAFTSPKSTVESPSVNLVDVVTAARSSPSEQQRKSYSLGNLYTFYFGQTAEVLHTAEDDCKIMFKLISLHVDKFIPYCDQNAVPFSDIEPMY